MSLLFLFIYLFFFFNDPATTEIYTLSLHDALPICRGCRWIRADNSSASFPTAPAWAPWRPRRQKKWPAYRDRKSTRLNSSHANISYAVFCLKKKKKKKNKQHIYRRQQHTCIPSKNL